MPTYKPMELAEIFLKTGELDDALDALNQQLSENPQDDTARRLRIQTQLRLSDSSNLTSALDDLEKLISKTAEDYQTASIIHQQMGHTPEAINAIEQARELAPQQERLTEQLVDLYVRAEQYEIALTLIREQPKAWRWLEREGDVLALLGDDILAIARYGLVLSHLTEYDGSMNADYLQALKLRVILARAHAYRRLKYIDIAREHYQEAHRIVSDDVTINFNLGLLEELDGNHSDAIQQCQFALDNAPSLLRQGMIESINDNPNFVQLKQDLNF